MSNDTNWLKPEWQQRCLDALRDTVDVDGDLKKDMIQFLLDTGFWSAKLTWDAAVSKFNACLRPDSSENFSNLALWALSKRFHRHAWVEAMVADLGGEIRWLPTEDRRLDAIERLATGIEAAVKLVAASLHDLKELDAEPDVRRVHRALREGAGSFSAGEVLPAPPMEM